MGVRMMVEVFDHWRDAGLTVGERSDLLVLAENANDGTRLTFGPVHAEYILRRAGKTAESWRVAISKLTKKGVLEHATRDGRPMRGHTGQYAVYRLVPLCPDPPHIGYKGHCTKPAAAASSSGREGHPSGDPSSGLGYPADNAVGDDAPEEGYPAATPTEPSDNPVAGEGYPAATERVIPQITPTPPYPTFKISSTTPSSSPADSVDTEPAVVAEVTDGGGGGDLSPSRPLAEEIAAALCAGQPVHRQLRETLTARLAAALDAGWTMDGLAVYLYLPDGFEGSPAAVCSWRLDPARIPVPEPLPAVPAAAGGIRGPVPSTADYEAATLGSLFFGEPPAPAPSRTWREAEARAKARLGGGGAGPRPGTDTTVAGWGDVKRQLAREKHTPYSNDVWSQPADPIEAAGIPHCGD